MANRYVVASGIWHSTSTWSDTSGGPAGASIPTSDDVVYLSSFPGTYTVNLTADAECIGIQFFRGRLNLNGYTLSLVGNTFNGGYLFSSDSTSSPIIDLSNSKLRLLGSNDNTVSQLIFGSNGPTNGTIVSTNSTVEVTIPGTTSSSSFFGVGSNTIDNLLFLMGRGSNRNNILTLFGSGTFNSLNIISVDNGISTVILNSSINVRRLISEGYSEGNKLTLRSNDSSQKTISFLGSNQIINLSRMQINNINYSGSGKYYVGSTSVNGGGNSNAIFDNAPKVDTLTDPFNGTTINTSRWTASGAYLSQSGGQLLFTATSNGQSSNLVSREQFLGEGSYVKFKVNISTGLMYAYFSNSNLQYSISSRVNIPSIYLILDQAEGTLHIDGKTNYTSTSFSNTYSYYRIRESFGTIYLDGSSDGNIYTNIKSAVASNYGVDTKQLIARPNFLFTSGGPGVIAIDDFNIDQEPAADFTQSVVSGFSPLSVNFLDQSNFNPTSWSWNFGDSTTSTLQNPSKTYSTPGTYTVSLTSSNSSYTRSVTKTGLITVSPNIYTRAISGTILFGGDVNRKINAFRGIEGTLLFGGSARAVVIKDTESIEEKRYLYKIYEPDGTYIEVWNDVISEPTFSQEINELGSTMSLELARNSDSVGTTTEQLMTESGIGITTESSLPIVGSIESKNQVGPGSSVVHNNRVDVLAYYGSNEPLLTEMGDEITTENDETILATLGSPNGRRIFTGFISGINSRYGNSETTLVQLSSYGWDLDQYNITNSSDETTVTFNSTEPSQIARTALDKFITDSAGFGTYTMRTETSIPNTGSVVSYTYRNNTYSDVLKKVVELMPSNWYFYVGLGDNTVYYAQRTAQPKHTFLLGKHLTALDLASSILDVTNDVVYTGGGEPPLYRRYTETPAPFTRRSLEKFSDSRVTVVSSAEIISTGAIEEKNQVQYRSTIEVLTKQYDIESINVGDTVGFRNFGNYVDELTMQIVGLTYSPDVIQLQLDTKPPTINKRLEDLRKNLLTTDNTNIPNEPA